MNPTGKEAASPLLIPRERPELTVKIKRARIT
jgi:hypothetical protein